MHFKTTNTKNSCVNVAWVCRSKFVVVSFVLKWWRSDVQSPAQQCTWHVNVCPRAEHKGQRCQKETETVVVIHVVKAKHNFSKALCLLIKLLPQTLTMSLPPFRFPLCPVSLPCSRTLFFLPWLVSLSLPSSFVFLPLFLFYFLVLHLPLILLLSPLPFSLPVLHL